MAAAERFVLFGDAHLVSLLLIFLLCLWVGRASSRDRNVRLAITLAALLMFQEALKLVLYHGIYEEPWAEGLPLNLCRANEFLCVYMLVKRSYRAFEVAYFWSMGGSVSAIITPDIAQGFPDPRFFSFFVGHGLVVVAVVYAVFGFGFRPRLRSIGVTLLVSGVYASIVAGLNLLLDTNYLYLRAKPAAPTILDLFGPWPGYLLGLVGLTVGVCLLCYAPFPLQRRLRR